MSQTVLSSQAASAQSAAEPSFALDRAAFEQARALFKQAAREKRLSAASLCAWSLLRGKDPRRGFSPVINPVKLANGARPWAAFDLALRQAQSLSPEALAPWAAWLAEAGCSKTMWSWKGDHPLLSALAAGKAPR